MNDINGNEINIGNKIRRSNPKFGNGMIGNPDGVEVIELVGSICVMTRTGVYLAKTLEVME